MQDELAAVRRGAMLEDVHRLPGPERELAVDDRDRELRRGQRGADVGGHVVGPLGGVAIQPLVLGHELPEERVEVAEHGGVGVLLHDERGRGVTNEDGEKPGRHLLAVDPRSQLARHVVEAGAARPDGEAMSRLPHASGLAQRASLLELYRYAQPDWLPAMRLAVGPLLALAIASAPAAARGDVQSFFLHFADPPVAVPGGTASHFIDALRPTGEVPLVFEQTTPKDETTTFPTFTSTPFAAGTTLLPIASVRMYLAA